MTAGTMEGIRFTELAPFGLVVEATGQDADLRSVDPAQLATWTAEAKVLVLRGFPLLSTEDLVAYCERWGELLLWDFGAVLDLTVEENPKNYLFTRGPVPYHWDGAFAKATPSFFLFQCQDGPAGAGGETVFCDTVAAYRDATAEQRALWDRVRITYRTDKIAHYGGQVTYPLVTTHPRTGETVLRYAEPLPPQTYLNPLYLDIDGIPEDAAERLVADLEEHLYRPEFCYDHAWRTGDIVIAENHALIHGRRAFVGDSSRRLQRVQII